MGTVDTFVEEYRTRWQFYDAYTTKIVNLINEVITSRGIRPHLIESRTKTVESFQEKIRRPGKFYENPLETMPDISGVRIILYYTDQIQEIHSIVKELFLIVEDDKSHSIDALEADRFGYLSDHCLVRIRPNRGRLTEWKMFKDLHAEIQIRTVLQHSWAAISHALQYKRESDVPQKLQRKLNRLAGLFELADEEFLAIRDTRSELQTEIKQSLQKGNSARVPIDGLAVSEFVTQWKGLKRLRKIAAETEFDIEDDTEYKTDYEKFIVQECHRVHINDIKALEKLISYDPESYLSRLTELRRQDTDDAWAVSSDFLVLLLFIKAIVEDLSAERLVESGGWDLNIARRVITAAKTS